MDRNLGKHVIAERLRTEGLNVEIHDDHLPLDAPDEEWLELVGRKGWLALTKDKNIRYRAAELQSIRTHRARVVVVRAKNATATDIAELLLKGKNSIARFAERTQAPFVAGIDRSGRVTPYRGVLEQDS
ncbi:MAG: hypothetical protein OXG44_16000 [Gammaproteobacteria bacterium]|nr:hypothetical protein [Gammaproteobacteria bacterium]